MEMDDLVTWLREQVDEDERVARAAMEPNDEGGCGPHWTVSNGAGGVDSPEGPIYYEDGGIPTSAQDEHIARHDPARELRLVAAHRRILKSYEDACERVRNPVSADAWTAARAAQFELEEVIRALTEACGEAAGERRESLA